MRIEFSEKSVFTFNKKELSIHIYNHKDGKYEGPIIGEIGSIKFNNKDQAYQFMEMIELMLENKAEDVLKEGFKID